MTELINGNVALPEELQEVPKMIKILEAHLKDDFCDYVYQYLQGVEKGNKQKSDSIYIVKEELKKAFVKFHVHMACLDDLFKNSGLEVTDIEILHNHDYTFLMTCTGFKVTGDDDMEQITLYGHKFVSGGARIKWESPKIPLDSLSSYRWYNELKAAADDARREVERYKYGNYTVPEDHIDEEEEEKKAKKKQTKLKFDKDLTEAAPAVDDLEGVFGPNVGTDEEMDPDFETAEID